MRTEKDSLGEKAIPDDVLYGIHTARSLENFQISGERWPLEIIYAIAKLKAACAIANNQLGMLERAKSQAIVKACWRIWQGELDDQFPLDVYQSGSGTSTNMNVNEVIANAAAEELGGRRGDRSLVHPHDHVNMGQSTNNVVPSAARIACVNLCGKLLDDLQALIGALKEKAQEFWGVLKSGRTHLADAVPVRLGQEFLAYAVALEKDARRLQSAAQKLQKIGLGGNAIGTGVNTKKEFRAYAIRELSVLDGVTYECPENGLEITQFHTDFVEVAGALKAVALDIAKICNDLRLMASGPNTGLNEIVLPAVEPGSSIMPGKVNPSVCEAVNMVCLQVIGNEQIVSMACSLGQLELNTHVPLIAVTMVKSVRLLSRALATLTEKCIRGITAHEAQCRQYLERSLGLATVLNPRLGYDRVADLVKEMRSTGKTLRQLIVEKGLMSEAEFEDLLARSTEPNLT
jgi:aspartate ammonia-lyase